jgi:hypothetical protein
MADAAAEVLGRTGLSDHEELQDTTLAAAPQLSILERFHNEILQEILLVFSCRTISHC